MKKYLILLFLLIPFLSFAQIDADLIAGGERILNFRSDIQIEQDGSMQVKETITVVATNEEIKHGIYRDFPTKYKDEYGNNYNVRFDVIRVMQDGAPQDFHFDSLNNGKRVYIGNKDSYVSVGVHTYELTYRTDRQLGFFKDHDELYWNVTGNGWVFSIEKAEAHVSLPTQEDNGKVNQTTAFIGVFGSKEMAFTSEIDDNSINFYTTRALTPTEGFTIVVGWPKGIIAEPTQIDKNKAYFEDNYLFFLSLTLLIVVIGYYLRVWNKVGRDPRPQAIIPQYETPSGLSPSAVRYIERMYFDDKTMVAAIINMAVKGSLKIDELVKNFRLTTLRKNESSLSREETAFYGAAFKENAIFEINSDNYAEVRDVKVLVEDSLKEEFGDKYFVKNFKYLKVGALLSIVALLTAVAGQSSGLYVPIIFMCVWITLWTFGMLVFIISSIQEWKTHKVRSTTTLLIGIVFTAIDVVMLYAFTTMSSVTFVAYLFTLLTINVCFAFLLPRRTEEGAKIHYEIKGLKWFLSVTEKDRMNFHNPPDKTPELFEKFLPYALALGVENKWADQFAEVFLKMGPEGYQPLWYSGHSFSSTNLAGFVSEMSSGMSKSISSSSVAPGSSSGFGGGSSGGGGGGGGGGGW